ncbi:MAG TPA: two-component regulator propeller domain-containing protein [Bryobacteraceae bacterium]|nr:two-component regulator propeller domain-containing protein [Bryobacteraceae bacterium]
MLGWRNVSVWWVLILITAPVLRAVNPNLSLRQYLHTSWTQEEGIALPPVQSLAQTSDGYLWLGTNRGLIRFDGMRFVDWSPVSGPELPALAVGRLCAGSLGGLWIATTAGLCRLERSRIARFPESEKGCRVIASMAQDGTERLWAINSCAGGTVLHRVAPAGKCETFGTRDGLPDQKLRAILEDRQGRIWIGTDRAVCRWSPGERAVCTAGPALNVSALAGGAHGELVVSDDTKSQVFRLADGLLSPISPRIPDSDFTKAMIVDRDGNIWIGTAGQGLIRIREKRVDRFTRDDGLSGNFVSGLIEDREGDIWIATQRGVDRIRDPKFQLYTKANGLSSELIDTVYAGADGAVWIGTSGGGIDRLLGDQVSVYARPAGLPHATVLATYEDAGGRPWVATPAGVAVWRTGRFSEVLTAGGEHLSNVFNIVGDASGAVWLADSKLGVFAVRGGVARALSLPAGDSADVVSLLIARNGEIWLGHQRGGITVLAPDGARQYETRDGLAGGLVRTLYEDAEGNIWAGTGGGLSRFRKAHWTNWTTAQGLPEGEIQGIVEDEAGGLWLLTPAGVLRVAVSSLDPPVKTLQFALYGPTEGLRLGTSMTNPRLSRSRDGRIWVATEDGMAAIDPARLKKNPVAPSVVIEQVTADGKNYDPAAGAEIAFRGHDLQIVYTGISLMVPERVRFRYRLEGADTAWNEAGSRRNVAYMNLPPAHYRFHVIACNNDGLWNNAGAEFALRVDPYFYQTRWFAFLCLVSVALTAWFAYQLNMRRVVSRLQLITAERIRFSRELHDSLLQGFSGVAFLLEAAERLFETAPERAKQQLDRAVEQADQSLREAREMISSMRIRALENHSLAEALRTTATQMASDLPVELQFEVKGRAVPGPYNVEANLFLLAREAVTNALQHAEAKHIRLELCYTPKELRLTVQDDGIGFDPDQAMEKAGHWGFRGMRERARVIGARFQVNSAPGRGATIEVGVGAGWKK